MGPIKSSDILVTPLQKIEVNGGDVMHGIKNGDAGYAGFGEAYFSWVSYRSIKAWKRHGAMVMNILVPVGKVRFVFCLEDGNGKVEFRVEDIGVDRYARITVPAGIWFGFQGIYEGQSLILNVASIPHHVDEVDRLAPANFDYIWS